LLTFFSPLFSQYSEEKKVVLDKLSKCTEDTAKVFYLNRYSMLNQSNDFKIAYEYATKALELSEKSEFIRGKVSSYNAIGNAYWYNDNYAQALTYYYKAYKINDSLKDKHGLAESLYNIGWIKVMQQDNHKEVSYLYKSLSIYTELNDPAGTASLMHTLGQYYCNYYMSTKNKSYFDSSYTYYNKAINLIQSGGDKIKHQYPKYYGSLGDLFALSGDYITARSYKEQTLEYHLKNGDSSRYYLNLGDLAEYEYFNGSLDKAITVYLQCYNYAKRNNKKDLLLTCADHLSAFYYEKNVMDKAYNYLRERVNLKDTLDKQLFSSSVNDIQNGFEIEKREANIKELKQQNEIQDLKAKQNRYALITGTVVLIIIIFIAYSLYKRNLEKNRINFQLQEKNNIITQKKQEIESSIQYAKGIQTSFFPEIEELNKIFPESFIFYRPKDVVSGDFYWFHHVDDCFYCVAADCTGHGVPGALMSIVSVDKITQAIFEKKLTQPSEILKFLNVEIKNALKQHDDAAKQKDGLDIALIKFNLKTSTLTYSSANRPVFVVQNSILTEYKPDKTAIAGFTPSHYEFTQTDIKLNKSDCVYIFSDGYADQFGGDDGKKFMTKNFKSLLTFISSKDMKAQETEIVNTHYNWKGTYEQVDDILVIGIKI